MGWLILIILGYFFMREFLDEINYSVISKVLDNFTKGRARELWEALKKTNLPKKKKVWIYLQARHETAGFRNFADSSHNYFGIKYADWMEKYGVRKTSPVWTIEWDKKEMKYKYIPSYFAKFNSAEQALKIYLKLAVVRKALKESDTVKEYFKKLKEYGYYTAPYTHYYYAIVRHAKELERYA